MGAVALADTLIRHFGDLRGVARASLEEITEVKGIGRVKAIEIKAALELGMRLARHNNTSRPRIKSAKDVSRSGNTIQLLFPRSHFSALLPVQAP